MVRLTPAYALWLAWAGGPFHHMYFLFTWAPLERGRTGVFIWGVIGQNLQRRPLGGEALFDPAA